MEKTLIISGRSVQFKSTGAFLLRYKAQFQKDAIADLLKMEQVTKEFEKGKGLENLDLTVFFNLIWTLAKTADPTIPPPMEWLDTFNEFPLMEIIPELQEMLFSTIKASVKSKN